MVMQDINPGRSEHFQLLKPLEDDVWLAERLSDREPFIARRLTELSPLPAPTEESRDAEGLTKLLEECGIDRALAQLLNHENILSLAGVIRQSMTSGAGEATEQVWLVWDFPDAGTLEQLFHDKRLAAEYTGKKYMPESLCWHVLRSVLGALAYLHEGARPFCEGDATESHLARVDDDWHPVLHGAVTPENIFFQHPRGTEEYGACKLGNFSGAFVSGKVDYVPAKPSDTPAMGVAAGLTDGKVASLDEIRRNLYSDVDPKTSVSPAPSSVPFFPSPFPFPFWDGAKPISDRTNSRLQTRKAYTVKDELWGLGAAVHQMMVGAPPPSPAGCPACNHECMHIQSCAAHPEGCAPLLAACGCTWGGCPHMPATPCPHPRLPQECPHAGCERTGVRFQDNLWRKHYSRGLIRAVLMLLRPGGWVEEWCLPGATSKVWEEVSVSYSQWLRESAEGAAFHGIEDDLMHRGLEAEKKREREMAAGEREEEAERTRIWGDTEV